MLANGIKLAFSKTKGDYQNLVGLKEVPEFGIEPEKVDLTQIDRLIALVEELDNEIKTIK